MYYYYYNYCIICTIALRSYYQYHTWSYRISESKPPTFYLRDIIILLLARLMGQYCFARCRL